MRTIVKKWGNSAAVRIPAAIMEEAGLALDQPMDIHVEEGYVIMEPIRPNEYVIAELIEAITAENLHAPVDFGPPRGKEIL